MNIPGHLAIAVLQRHYLMPEEEEQAAILALYTASLFPDVIDKSIGYLFHWMPNGRHFTHNLFSLTLLSIFITVLWGRAAGYGWFIGQLGHMIVDSDSTMPWLYPFKKYNFRKGRLKLNLGANLRELVFLLLIISVYRR